MDPANIHYTSADIVVIVYEWYKRSEIHHIKIPLVFQVIIVK